MALAGSADIREVIFGRELSYLLFIAVLAAIVFLVRLLDAFLFDFVIARRKHVQAPLLLREIISIILYVALLSSTVSWLFNYSIRGLLATTTVVAAVIGLALQETLGNLFSGISLHMERTFDVGDVVKSGEHIGVVERVGWRAARLRTFGNNVVVLPNSLLSRERIEVFTRGHANAHLVSVGVAYEHDPATVMAVLARAASSVEGVASSPASLARIRDFAESSITYEVKYWTHTYQMRDSVDAEIRRVLWYALRRNDLTIPYPIRVLRQEAGSAAEAHGDGAAAGLLQRLRGVELFAPMSDEERSMVAARTRHARFGRGEAIIHAGEEADSMFVIERGTVAVQIKEEGRVRELAQLHSGEVFGEMALLTGEARSADVFALTEVEVFEIHKDALQPVIAQNPALASGLSAQILQRRQHLESSRVVASGPEDSSLVARIRSWFGV